MPTFPITYAYDIVPTFPTTYACHINIIVVILLLLLLVVGSLSSTFDANCIMSITGAREQVCVYIACIIAQTLGIPSRP